MKKDKHVYCTCCVHGKNWIKELSEWQNSQYYFCHNAAPDLPEICITCYPFNPEDSRQLYIRPNYKVSFSGWWWLTKWDIEEFFKYRRWRYWFKK